MPTSKKRQRVTAETLAARLVTKSLPDLCAIMEAHPGEWDALLSRLRMEYLSPSIRRDTLTLKEHVALTEKLRDRLPDEDARKQLWRLIESMDNNAMLKEQAAFMVGLRLGQVRGEA